MNFSPAALFAVLPTLVPFLGLGVTGLYFAVTRRLAHPGVSLLASMGFLCLIINAIGHAGLTIYILSNRPDLAHQAAFVLWYGVASVSLEVVDLAGLVLLAFAVFAGRKTAPGNA
jgi:hypothetical protein